MNCEIEPSLPFVLTKAGDRNGDGRLELPLSVCGEAGKRLYEEGYTLTSWTEDDMLDAVELYNHPSVGKWSLNRPYPYTMQHTQYIVDFLPKMNDYLSLLRTMLTAGSTATDTEEEKRKRKEEILSYHRSFIPFPLGALRDPNGKLIGDVQMFISNRVPPTSTSSSTNGIDQVAVEVEVEVEVEVGAKQVEGEGEEEGEGEKIEKLNFEIAYNLSPDHWNKGLGKCMILSLVRYARWLGIKSLTGTCELENIGSATLLRKTGFGLVNTYELEWPQDKGGGKRTVLTFQQDL